MTEGYVGRGGQKLPVQGEVKRLDPKETEKLDTAIKDGKLTMFVAQASGFPNMDGDLYTPMEYYLASVVDYLNWVHGDKKIALNTVLDKRPTSLKERPLRETRPQLPGCDFEQDDDLKHWKTTEGTAARNDKWSGFGSCSLRLDLKPGGEAVYTPPAEQPVVISQKHGSFAAKIYLEHAQEKEVKVTIELTGENGKVWTVSQLVPKGENRIVVAGIGQAARFKQLKQLKITSNSKGPVVLHIDDLCVHRQR